MKLFRIETIRIHSVPLLARGSDNAVYIMEHALIHGLGNNPAAAFEVTPWQAGWTFSPGPLKQWKKEGKRGLIWLVDDARAWELRSTEPE